MSYKYMILNNENIAESIVEYNVQLIDQPSNYVKVEDATMLWHKYENKQWSSESYAPNINISISENQEITQKLELMQKALNDLILGGV
ncbi:hypothetical protein CLSAB_19480 [Clostridium saccharobutylicum]|uniref:hypothetical protein n=1 Tax=Clostridium saccharobutylicum TaxID=169679 RepID=UPI00098C71B9|nr:hypothetical protein [Clostridium saccharobutylicum]OOM17228.1 hypothetical protein CLSAB_19480 [Clostridium saccharobutylicum]